MSRPQSSSRALAGWNNDEHVPTSSIVAGCRHEYSVGVGKVCVGNECIMWSPYECKVEDDGRAESRNPIEAPVGRQLRNLCLGSLLP